MPVQWERKLGPRCYRGAGRLFLFALLLASPALAQERHGGLSKEEWLLVASSAADVVSTEMMLAEGGRELNPLGQNRAVRIAGKAGLAAFLIWGTRELREDGHRTAAAWLSRCAIAAQFGVASWNVSLSMRLD